MVSAHRDSPEIPVPEWLQQAWVRQLHEGYSLFNYLYTSSQLRIPAIRVGNSRRRLGQWCPRTRCITISGHHILENPWGTVLDTLRHEMAHQYVHDILGFHDVPPHGEAFKKACFILRVDPATSAAPEEMGILEKSSAARDRALARVKKLLALAESPNEHEAANAMRMARRYLLKYNVDLAELNERRNYRTRQLGKCRPRVQEYEYTLGRILREQFFVELIWMPCYDPLTNRTGRAMEISGTPENLEMAEYVHDFVMNVSAQLWKEHKRSGKARGTKLQYLAGLLRGFAKKLDVQSNDLAKNHSLVWKGDPALKEYYRYMNPKIGKISSRGVSRNASYESGMEDGKRLTLRRGVSEGSTNRGRLLS